MWWQGQPWAGKTALLAWAASNPPPGVEAVSFFVTRRYAGHSDYQAYLSSMNAQFAAISGTARVESALTGIDEHAIHLELLRMAAARSAEVGNRLLLIIDGLDEDAGVASHMQKPSIASILPKRLPENVRIIVASRSNFSMPNDVLFDHPLRHLTAVDLSPSVYAHDIELGAAAEIETLADGPDIAHDILGLLAAAGGGLTLSDLSALTSIDAIDLSQTLLTKFRRSIVTHTPRSFGTDQDDLKVFLFAHETLREAAEQYFAPVMDGLRQRIHTWIDVYSDQGWPITTPMYAVRGYFSLLLQTDERERIVNHATSMRRHNLLLEGTGLDTTALEQVKVSIGALSNGVDLNLGSIIRLKITHSLLSSRNKNIPIILPAVWAKIGRVRRAVALAAGLPESDQRCRALVELATAVTRTAETAIVGNLMELAELAAADIEDPLARSWALIDVVRASVSVADHARALRLSKSVMDLSGAAFECEKVRIAEYGAIRNEGIRLGELVLLIGEVDLGAAEDIGLRIRDSYVVADGLSAIATTAHRNGDLTRAARLFESARMYRQTIEDDSDRRLLETRHRERVADLDGSPVGESRQHSSSSKGPSRAAVCAARDLQDRLGRIDALLALGEAAAKSHVTLAVAAERAAEVEEELDESEGEISAYEYDKIHRRLLGIVGLIPDADWAERLIEHIDQPEAKSAAVLSMVRLGAFKAKLQVPAHLLNDAARDAQTQQNPHDALAKVALAAADAGEIACADEIAWSSEVAARSVLDVTAWDRALKPLAIGLARAKRFEIASLLCGRIVEDVTRRDAVREVAVRAAPSEGVRFVELLTSCLQPHFRWDVLADAALAAARAGDKEGASVLIAAAERDVERHPHSVSRALEFVHLSAKASQFDIAQAQSLAAKGCAAAVEATRDNEFASYIWGDVVLALYKSGEVEKAAKCLPDAIQHDGSVGYSLLQLVRHLAARHGVTDAALQAAKGILNSVNHTAAIAALFDSAIDRSDLDGILESCLLPQSEWPPWLWQGACSAALTVGDLATSLLWLDQVIDEEERQEIVFALIAQACDMGEYRIALEISDRIVSLGFRSISIGAIIADSAGSRADLEELSGVVHALTEEASGPFECCLGFFAQAVLWDHRGRKALCNQNIDKAVRAVREIEGPEERLDALSVMIHFARGLSHASDRMRHLAREFESGILALDNAGRIAHLRELPDFGFDPRDVTLLTRFASILSGALSDMEPVSEQARLLEEVFSTDWWLSDEGGSTVVSLAPAIAKVLASTYWFRGLEAAAICDPVGLEEIASWIIEYGVLAPSRSD